MPEFKWIDTHTYPDYNVILTKKYVKAMCMQHGVSIDSDALDVLRRILTPQKIFFIRETCNHVIDDCRVRITYKDVLTIIEKFFPELVFILSELYLSYKIIKLFLGEGCWRCYIYFPESTINIEEIERWEFRRIYPHFYFIERSV